VAGSCEHGNELTGSWKSWKFVATRATVSFSRRTLLRGVTVLAGLLKTGETRPPLLSHFAWQPSNLGLHFVVNCTIPCDVTSENRFKTTRPNKKHQPVRRLQEDNLLPYAPPSWSLSSWLPASYVKAQWWLCAPPALTINNSAFFMGFIWFSQ
jgi:hypothetical protein